MKKDQIVENIVDILSSKSKSSRGVIMLNGPWGCGKTYLYKNQIEPKLVEKLSIQKIPVIYLSIFGLDSISSVKYSIIAKLLTKKETWVQDLSVNTIKSTLKNFFTGGVKVLQDQLGGSLLDLKLDPLDFWNNEFVVCIDDIERKSQNINIKDLLGLVSILKDIKNCRVLLISNEEELMGEEGFLDQNEKVDYRKFMEKIITYRFPLSPSIEEMYDLITSEMEECEFFFTNQKSFIIEILLRAKVLNLRTLDKILANMFFILSNGIKLSHTHIHIIIFYTACSAEGILSKGKKYFEFNAWSLSRAGRYQDNEKMLSAEEEEKVLLIERFYDEKISYNFSEELFDFISTGMFDFEKIKMKIDPDPKVLTQAQKYIKSFNENRSIWWANDKELNEHYSDGRRLILNYNNDIDAKSLANILMWMETCKHLLQEKIEEEVITKARSIFILQAQNGDTSFSKNNRYHYRLESDFLNNFLNDYDSNLPIGLSRKISEEFESIISLNNKNEAIQFIQNDHDNLKYICETVLKKNILIDLYYNDPESGYDLIVELSKNMFLLKDDVLYESYQIEIYIWINRVLEDKRLQKSDKSRMKLLLRDCKKYLTLSVEENLTKFPKIAENINIENKDPI